MVIAAAGEFNEMTQGLGHSTNAGPALSDPSPIFSLMGGFGNPSQMLATAPKIDPMAQFQQALNTTAKANPLTQLDNTRVAIDPAANKAKAADKGAAAEQGAARLHAMAASVLKNETASSKPGQAPQGGGVGGLVGGAIGGAIITGGLSAIGMGFAATAYGALEGMGTFSKAANMMGSTLSMDKNDGDYNRDGASSPQNNDFTAMMAQGPGFGPMDATARTKLSGDMMGGITALKLDTMIAQSPAMRTLSEQKHDADTVLALHEAREKRGLPATEDNLDALQNMGIITAESRMAQGPRLMQMNI